MKTVGIAGLGLIGGSMALALKAAGYTVLGLNRNPEVMKAAEAAGIEPLIPDDFHRPDIWVLGFPPDVVISFLEQKAAKMRSGCVVTEVCGVKKAIVGPCQRLCEAAGLRFVGGHPMAGKEVSGFAAADPKLFVGASYILTPVAGTDEAALEEMKALALDLGCGKITITDPETHDRMIAFTSQLPHVLAGAYVRSPQSKNHSGYSAGSYRDVSRVAPLDETLWNRLFILNAGPLCDEIDLLIAHLKECRDAVAAGDADKLQAVLRAGKQAKIDADK